MASSFASLPMCYRTAAQMVRTSSQARPVRMTEERAVEAAATFSPIAKAQSAATCGPERRVNAKGFVLVSPRWPLRGALLAQGSAQ